MKCRGKKEWLFAAAFLLTAAFLVNFLSDVFRPGRVDYGSTWSAYRAEPRNTIDVLYLGSSYAYCDFHPALIYDACGLTGFVLAGSEQPLSITYWYLKEAFRTQSPQAVVIEGTSLFFQPYQNYTQINIGYMPFSANKLGAIFTSAEEELRLGLLFDLWSYHTRWKELSAADVGKALFPIRRDHYKGFTAIGETLPGVGEAPYVADREIEETVYRDNLEWLGKIFALCREHGVQPVLVFNPTYSQCTQALYEKLGRDAKELDEGLVFRNWSDQFAQFGLEPTRHLYDGGHLNRDGAAVFAPWVGRLLTQELGLSPTPQTPENAQAWEESVRWWRSSMGETSGKA